VLDPEPGTAPRSIPRFDRLSEDRYSSPGALQVRWPLSSPPWDESWQPLAAAGERARPSMVANVVGCSSRRVARQYAHTEGGRSFVRMEGRGGARAVFLNGVGASSTPAAVSFTHPLYMSSEILDRKDTGAGGDECIAGG
jgi:hypothetical protein